MSLEYYHTLVLRDVSTINPSMQSDQNGHWSHLSDLASQDTPLSLILLLKQLLTRIPNDFDTPRQARNTT